MLPGEWAAAGLGGRGTCTEAMSLERASNIAQQIKALAVKSDKLSSRPGTAGRRREDPSRLSSKHYIHRKE